MDIEEFIKNAEIPSLPEVVFQLYDLVNRDRSMEEIASVLRMDPALTARTLEVANSAWYKRSHEIGTVNEAIAMIGTSTLYQLVFTASITRLFVGLPEELVHMNKFWRQSYLMASYAQAASRKVDGSQALTCFTSGIMAYLGKLVLYNTEPVLSSKILNTMKQKQMPQYQVENFFLGFNHADIGAAMLQGWNFPESIYLPVKYYPLPEKAAGKVNVCTSLLNIAHYMQYTYATNLGVTDPPSKVNKFALNTTGITESDLSALAAGAQDNYETAISVLKL